MTTVVEQPTGHGFESVAPRPTKVAGMLAEFETPGALLAASAKVRDAGYTKWDTHTPFPVHGIDDAMGVRPTILPWFALVAGLSGIALACGFQLWANGIDYPMIISGKPLFAVPANVPIMFELMVLFAAFTTFFAVFILNGLPEFYHALFTSPRFAKASDDKFFIYIEADDPRYVPGDTKALLDSLHPTAVETLRVPAIPARLPSWFAYVGIALLVFSVFPPAAIIKARYEKFDYPRIEIIQDMDFQPKYKTQKVSPLFTDGRADRSPIYGTVARGFLKEDEHFHFGRVDGQFARTFPASVEVTDELMARGQQRFNIYCSACHGLAGDGNGTVNVQAQLILDPNWTKAPSLVTDARIVGQPIGELFNTITNGVQQKGKLVPSMPSYAAQISETDRWAIVLYVKALQRGSNASFSDVPEDARAALDAKRGKK